MKLSALVALLRRARLFSTGDVEILKLASDSRDVGPGTLFIALRGGGIQDRHQYIPVALERGAVALLVAEWQPEIRVPQVVVPDVRLAAAILADAFYNHPSHRLKVIGITGTNGKTSVAQMIDCVLSQAGRKTGVLGTLGKRVNGVLSESKNTTPEAVGYQAVLSEMVDAGCEYAITEASSQALDLRRVVGTRYHAAVFTNLTQDHLDYHGTMEAYLGAKSLLFSRLGNTFTDSLDSTPYGVVNADDTASGHLSAQSAVECYTYGIVQSADVQATDVEVRIDGIHFTVVTAQGSLPVSMNVSGKFNVYNALAAITVGLAEGIPLAAIVTALSSMPVVPGRLEPVCGVSVPFAVLVDYSHTPDGLENALSSARQFASQRLLCVVGCGGDRDKTKRPMMAKIAVQYSDIAIFTSDNPRSEDPDAILDDMIVGISDDSPRRGLYERIRDRRLAIQRAVLLAEPGDVVVIAGKGHETYQIIGSQIFDFDDKEVAREAMKLRVQENEPKRSERS